MKRIVLAAIAALALAPSASAQDDGLGLDGLGDIFRLLVSPAPLALPSPSPFGPRIPSLPAPTQVAAPSSAKACPLCGASVPVSEASKGAVWGVRLDLRRFGAGLVDPPEAPVCPSCRFPLYADSFTVLEIDRLKAFVASASYKGIGSGEFPYYRVARILEAKVVPLRYGSYSIALAYLRAAWQAEDYRDDARTTLYLEKALGWMDSYAAETKRGDYYYATSRLLPAEFLRRLKRFEEAESRLKPLETDADFQTSYLKRIIAAELALVKAGEWKPQASP